MRRSICSPFRNYLLVLFFLLAGIGILSPIVGTGVLAQLPDIPERNTWVTDGPVFAIVNEGDVSYIGGDFTYVGPNTGHGVPIDEASGHPVPFYLRVDGPVNASVGDGAGGWYIGGDFEKVGNVVRNHIAHILSDGTVDVSWNPKVGLTVGKRVSMLLLYTEKLSM